MRDEIEQKTLSMGKIKFKWKKKLSINIQTKRCLILIVLCIVFHAHK